MTEIEIEGQTEVGGDDVDMGENATIGTGAGEATTDVGGVLTTAITYSSESVTVAPTISTGASMVVMMGAEVCAGGVCELAYNATPTTATAASTEITVMVTAENGYNDHEYAFSVLRANPVDNVPENQFTATDDDTTTDETVGGSLSETVWTLAAVAGTTVEITFDFKTVDYPTGHTLAGDAMWCQTAEVTDGGTDLDEKDAARGDECDGMRFDVEMPATAEHERDLTVKITSEDGEVRTTFIRLTATAAASLSR